jgi:hypothetical protein
MSLAKFFIFFVALKLLSQTAELIGIANAIVNSFFFLSYLILRFSKTPTDNYKNMTDKHNISNKV